MSPARLPRALLGETVQVAELAGTGARAGQTYGAPANRAAHVERRARIVIDDRPDSQTRGQEVVSTATVITQLEHHAAPGSRITVDGTVRQVIASAGHRHRLAPQHAEHWVE